MATDERFASFISYRRILPDAECALALQEELEGFQIPKSFRTDAQRTRLGRVYLDQRETTVGRLQDLHGRALANSKALIVVCSKLTRESPWVEEEARKFLLAHGEYAPVIAVLLEGTVAESCPDALVELHLQSAGTHTHRLDVVRADNFRRKRSLIRRSNVPTMEVAAALLGVDQASLAPQLKAERRKRLLSLVAILAASMATVAGLIAWTNSRIIWTQTQERRLSAGRELLAFSDGPETVTVSSPISTDTQPWQWNPQSNQVSRPTENVVEDRHHRFAFVYNATGISVRNLASLETRSLGLTPALLEVANRHSPIFDETSERVLVADRTGLRFAIQVVSLATLAVEATIELGDLTDQAPGPFDGSQEPPMSPDQQRENNASELWNRVAVLGGRLLAPNAADPYSPLIRDYPSGAPIGPLLGFEHRFAFPVAFHSDTSTVAAISIGPGLKPALCVQPLSMPGQSTCAALPVDREADFEGGQFSQSGRTLWLMGNDRVAAYDGITLKLLLYVAPPEPLRIVGDATVHDTDAGWILWTSAGRNWAARTSDDFAAVDAGDVRIAAIESAFWSQSSERVLIRYDRRIALVETPRWRRVEEFDMPEGTVDVRPTLDGQAWSAQLSDGQLAVFSFDRGRAIARVTGVGGVEHRLWLDAPCRALNVLSRAGQVLRFQEGREYFDRWFVPSRDCNTQSAPGAQPR